MSNADLIALNNFGCVDLLELCRKNAGRCLHDYKPHPYAGMILSVRRFKTARQFEGEDREIAVISEGLPLHYFGDKR